MNEYLGLQAPSLAWDPPPTQKLSPKAVVFSVTTPQSTVTIDSTYFINPKKRHPMSVMQEFKEFAIKGNVIDLAVGVIIGAAFGKIVDSVVTDLIMPIIGAVVGKLDFSSLFLVLGEVPLGVARTLDGLKKAGVPVLAYGNFITVAVNFAILAFIIFFMVKQINRLKKAQVQAPALAAVTPEDVLLLREIRDSLKRD
jgi:large conductance mechanosensitive channel